MGKVGNHMNSFKNEHQNKIQKQNSYFAHQIVQDLKQLIMPVLVKGIRKWIIIYS